MSGKKSSRRTSSGTPYIDRDWLVQAVKDWMKGDCWTAVLVGEPGIGTSAFLRQLAAREKDSILIDVRPPLDTHRAQGFWAALLSQLEGAKGASPGSPYEAARLAAELLPPGGKKQRLLLIDSLEKATHLIDSGGLAGLDRPLPGVKLLIACRPGPHVAILQRGGARIIRIDPRSKENLQAVRNYVGLLLEPYSFGEELVDRLTRQSGGNFLVARTLAEAVAGGELSPHRLKVNPEALDSALWALWQDVVNLAPQESRHDLSRVACMLCDAGEPLNASSLADFLSLPSVRVQEVLVHLEPVLSRQSDRYALFNPRMNQTISRYLRRDLVSVHGEVVSFFRETYPSWEEMDDRYGWFYLGHHCDRFARTSRRRDYSVLHWLSEGPYIRAKLEKTRSLKSVLEDLRRGLRAALDENDLPRIVSYGLKIPRLRAEEAARNMHELADEGRFPLALESARLIVSEASRFKGLLLLAWQARDEGKTERATELLEEAVAVPRPLLQDEDLSLFLRIVGDLAQNSLWTETALRLLFHSEDPMRIAGCCLGIGRSGRLPRELRIKALETGVPEAQKLDDPARERMLLRFGCEMQRLGQDARAAELLPEGHKAPSPPVDASELAASENPPEAFREALDKATRTRWEPHRVSMLNSLADAVARVSHREMAGVAFMQLMQAAVQVVNPGERLRAIIGLAEAVAAAGRQPYTDEALDRLSATAETLQQLSLKAQAKADIGAARFALRQIKESDALFSEAASLSFRLEDRHEKSRTLASVAGAVARTGNSIRARDLAFHSIQAAEEVPEYAVDFQCRGTLKMGLAATISRERTLEFLEIGADLLKQLDFLGPRHRAATLATLANGVVRLGDSTWGRKILNQAVGAARAMVPGPAQAVTLAGLAAQEAESGDPSRADQILKEAEEAVGHADDPAAKAEGFAAISSSLAAMGNQPLSEHYLGRALDELDRLDATVLAGCRALLTVAARADELVARSRLEQLVTRSEKVLDELDLPEREEKTLALIQVYLALVDHQKARALVRKMDTSEGRSRALEEMAVAQVLSQPEEGLALLRTIPLVDVRMQAIRRCTVRLGQEIRPSQQDQVRRVLTELTLLAVEEQETADIVCSRWVYFDQNPKSLERTARKMGWLVEDGPVSQVQLRQQPSPT